MNLNPHGNVNSIRDQILKLGYHFTKDQIRSNLKYVRQEIYPSDNNFVFTPSYYACLQSKLLNNLMILKNRQES